MPHVAIRLAVTLGSVFYSCLTKKYELKLKSTEHFKNKFLEGQPSWTKHVFLPLAVRLYEELVQQD